MMILDSGLLFWATLYTQHKNSFPHWNCLTVLFRF